MPRTPLSRSGSIYRARALSAAAVVFGASIGAAQADDFIWSTVKYGGGSGGAPTAELTFGVPETDNSRVRAVCSAPSPRQTVTLVIGYNTGKLRYGTKVNAQFLYDANLVHREPATVYSSDSGEGLSGLRMELTLDSQVWDVLARYRSIAINADRRRPISLSLRGSSRAIDRFRTACANIWRAGGTVVDDRDNEENNVASARSCRLWGRIKSRDSRRPITVRFINRTRSQRTVMWLDYSGQPKEYGLIEPGQTFTQQTFVGHPWMFTDGPGNCKEIFVPERASQVSYNITFDN
ncbi:MAG: hypothetical protein AAFR55_08445 [Pseudomonadota bacterium]